MCFCFFVSIYFRMIFVCPNCGFPIGRPVNSGLLHCSNCNLVSCTSEFNKLLSWAWEIRNGKDLDIVDRDQILSIENYKILKDYIQESEYSHDEFYKFLKGLNISESIT